MRDQATATRQGSWRGRGRGVGTTPTSCESTDFVPDASSGGLIPLNT